MTIHTTATFDITAWEPEEYHNQDGVTLARTHVVKAFHGELEGESSAELLMAGAPGGSAAYVGVERVMGRLHGKQGSFVLIHNASMSRDGQFLTLTIMRDSGTGELAGIHGEGTVTIDEQGGHTLTLDYHLD